jgi:hypothetical protein
MHKLFYSISRSCIKSFYPKPLYTLIITYLPSINFAGHFYSSVCNLKISCIFAGGFHIIASCNTVKLLYIIKKTR